MLGNPSSNTYRQYKADTDFVASWLATTAKVCGYPNDALMPPTENSPSPHIDQKHMRLKDNAGNLATETSNPAAFKTTHTYKIALSDFMNLARFISEYKKRPVKVPSSFFTVIDRAIKLRKSHSSMFATLDGESKKHNYFVGILGKVRSILHPLIANDSRLGERVEPNKGPSNRFANLKVHEPSESVHNVPNKTNSSKKSSLNVFYEAALLESTEEAFFSFGLLINDLNEIRQVIAETWKKYKEGTIDLVAASLTTNTAFDLVKHMVEDMDSANSANSAVETTIERWYGRLIRYSNDNDHSSHLALDVDEELYTTSKYAFGSVYAYLFKLMGTVKNHPRETTFFYYVHETLKPNYTVHDGYNPASDRSAKSTNEAFSEDLHLLEEAMLEFYLYTTLVQPVPAEDQLTKEVRVMFVTQKISLSVLFGLQVFLDIHHLLRMNVSKGFFDLKRFAASSKSSLESMYNYNMNPKNEDAEYYIKETS